MEVDINSAQKIGHRCTEKCAMNLKNHTYIFNKPFFSIFEIDQSLFRKYHHITGDMEASREIDAYLDISLKSSSRERLFSKRKHEN